MLAVKLDWKKVYFGKVSRKDIQKYVPDGEWQVVRYWMKGKALEQKYQALVDWLETCNYSEAAKVQTTNYVTALSRGGLIKPEDYREEQ